MTPIPGEEVMNRLRSRYKRNMNYTFHPHAEKELEEIENDYDSILEGLGDRFREDIEVTISRILSFPMAGGSFRNDSSSLQVE